MGGKEREGKKGNNEWEGKNGRRKADEEANVHTYM